MSENRLDDIIVADMNRQSGIQPAAPAQPIPMPEIEAKEQVEVKALDEPAEVPHETSANTETPKVEEKETTQEPESNQKVTTPIDEYGNPIEPPKMYSEDEVQRMIRDRLSRGRHAEQPTQQQVQKVAEDFKTDPNSEDTWETQLEDFVDKAVDKREAKRSRKQWEQQEQAKQADFEVRFSTGMSKYSDFQQVVANKPITDSMMLAARALENPAAFIYGAAKLHPGELERISRIGDPYAQASEVGRLHERMVKTRNATSNAPKPLEAPKSDITAKRTDARPNIDSLILLHAKQKQARK